MIPMLDLRAQFETIAPEIRAAVEKVLTAQQFVLGPQGEALENEIAEACGARYGVGLASGTEALELGLHACGVKAGDEVIVPAFTFIATGSAVSALGARPVFVDVEPATFNLDPEQIEARITPRTRAIVVVHLFGLAADMDPILAVAEKHGIPVIEDNAQSFGATYRGRKTGSMGRIGCLSFYPSKNLGAYGDAGMIVTSDETLAARLRNLRNHGQTGQYLSTERGWNSRLDELQAAILRVKLRHLADWTAARQAHAGLYGELLKDVPGLVLPRVPPGREHVYYLYTIRVEGRAGGYTRANDRGNEVRSDLVQQRLKERGVASMVYYPVPLHLQPLYALLGGKPGELRVSERAAHEVLSIPIYPELTREQVERVAQEVRKAAVSDK
jgi:dTDP-4-amino-4,6-dideoxygalactose transaminase